MSLSPEPRTATEDDVFVALPVDSEGSDHEEAYDDDEEDGGFGSDWTDEFTSPTRLAGLLEQAKINMEKAARSSLKKARLSGDDEDEDDEARDEELDILLLEDENKRDTKMPKLDVGSSLPALYIEWDKNGKTGAPSRVRNLDAEQLLSTTRAPVVAEKKDDGTDDDGEDEPELDVTLPAPAEPVFEIDAKGKRITKRDKRERKTATAGSNWYDLPAPPAAELPKLYREVEAMRLRNQLDPKRFYRKDESEGRGIKGLPKYFAIGTVVATPAPFGGAAPGGDNLPRAARKRTIVDELVDDAEARRYAKRKFSEFQGGREAKGRRTLKDKQAKRARKW